MNLQFFSELFGREHRPSKAELTFLIQRYNLRLHLLNWVRKVSENLKINNMPPINDLLTSIREGDFEPEELHKRSAEGPRDQDLSNQSCRNVAAELAKAIANLVKETTQLALPNYLFKECKQGEGLLVNQNIKTWNAPAALPEASQKPSQKPEEKSQQPKEASWKERPDWFTEAWRSKSYDVYCGTFQTSEELAFQKGALVQYWAIDPPFGALNDSNDLLDPELRSSLVAFIDRHSDDKAIGTIYCSRDVPGSTYMDWVQAFEASKV